MLIERARQRSSKPYYYGDIARALGLTTSTEDHRNQLSKVLGEIAEFEHRQGRPLLSAIVTYDPSGKSNSDFYAGGDSIHGPGLYNIAEQLGIGSKKELMNRNFGIEEMKFSFKFWKDDTNYQRFADIPSNGLPFFTQEEIHAFSQVVDTPYAPSTSEHQVIKEEVIHSLLDKTKYWSEQIVDRFPGFRFHFKRNTWTQLSRKHKQTFKHYLWSRIFREGHTPNVIFVVGIEGKVPGLYAKLEALSEGKHSLPSHQLDIFRRECPPEAGWWQVHVNDIADYDWDRLLRESTAFIERYVADYDRIQRLINNAGDAQTRIEDDNQLVPGELPEGIDAWTPNERIFNGRDVDYEQEARERKSLGDSGESLVLSTESKLLNKLGRTDLAEKVEKKKDGEGYDILSFDPATEQERYIEVKTTSAGKETPFYLSRNEWEFALRYPDQYCIYRLYEYDPKLNSARYFVIDNVAESVVTDPIAFRVLPKKRS